MEIVITISSKEMANTPAPVMQDLMNALQAIAKYDDVTVLPAGKASEVPQDDADEAKPVKKSKTAKDSPKAQEAKEKSQSVETAKEEPIPVKEEVNNPEPVKEEAVKPVKEDKEATEPTKEEEDAKSDIPDRDAVRKRLNEIRKEDETRAPKILAILHEFGVKKFSELPDEHLADVLAKAEAL